MSFWSCKLIVDLCMLQTMVKSMPRAQKQDQKPLTAVTMALSWKEMRSESASMMEYGLAMTQYVNKVS